MVGAKRRPMTGSARAATTTRGASNRLYAGPEILQKLVIRYDRPAPVELQVHANANHVIPQLDIATYDRRSQNSDRRNEVLLDVELGMQIFEFERQSPRSTRPCRPFGAGPGGPASSRLRIAGAAERRTRIRHSGSCESHAGGAIDQHCVPGNIAKAKAQGVDPFLAGRSGRRCGEGRQIQHTAFLVCPREIVFDADHEVAGLKITADGPTGDASAQGKVSGHRHAGVRPRARDVLASSPISTALDADVATGPTENHGNRE